jgi:hypothetical protein
MLLELRVVLVLERDLGALLLVLLQLQLALTHLLLLALLLCVSQFPTSTVGKVLQE